MVIIQRRCVVCEQTRAHASPLILKYTKHIGCGCIMVQCGVSARVQFPGKKRRMNIIQLFWLTVLGMRGHMLDAHLSRSCKALNGYACMNPAHMIYTKTGEPMSVVIPKLFASSRILPGRMFGGGRRSASTQEPPKTAPSIRPVVVVDEESMPTHAADTTTVARVVDYMLIMDEDSTGG